MSSASLGDLSDGQLVIEELDSKLVQSSASEYWNLFFYISNMIAWMGMVVKGVDQQIDLINKLYGTHVASPIHHEASQLGSSQAILAFRSMAAAAAIAGACTASSALARDFILAEDHQKNYVKSAMDFVQYSASIVGLLALTGIAGAALVKALPFIMMGLLAANLLYQVGSLFVNLAKAISAWMNSDREKRNDCLKAAAMNLVSIALNALVFLSFLFVLKPLFVALKSGSTAALVAVFKHPLQILLASTFFVVLTTALVKTATEFKQDIKQAWQDPTQALCNLFATDMAIGKKLAEKWQENKAKGLAYGALALVILPARMALALLKALALLIMMAAKGTAKASVLIKESIFSKKEAMPVGRRKSSGPKIPAVPAVDLPSPRSS